MIFENLNCELSGMPRGNFMEETQGREKGDGKRYIFCIQKSNGKSARFLPTTSELRAYGHRKTKADPEIKG